VAGPLKCNVRSTLFARPASRTAAPAFFSAYYTPTARSTAARVKIFESGNTRGRLSIDSVKGPRAKNHRYVIIPPQHRNGYCMKERNIISRGRWLEDHREKREKDLSAISCTSDRGDALFCVTMAKITKSQPARRFRKSPSF